MNIGRLCNRNVVTINKDTSIIEAAQEMRKHHVGDLVVVEQLPGGSIPVGVLTDRDIVVGILAQDVEHLPELQVADVLSDQVVLAREDEDLADVLEKMTEHSVRRLPVVDSIGVLVGIFTLDDLLGLISADLASIAALVSRQREREAQRRPT